MKMLNRFRKRMMVIMLSGLMAAGGCISGGVISAVANETKAYSAQDPEVQVSFDKREASPGDNIHVTLKVTKNRDAMGGTIILRLKHEQISDVKSIYLSEVDNDTFEGTIEVKDYWYNGNYNVECECGFADLNIIVNDPVSLHITSAIEIPVIKKIMVDKKTVSAGESIEVVVSENDITGIGTNGISSFYLSVSVGKGLYYWSTYLTPDGKGNYRGVFEVNDRWLKGDYKINYIRLYHVNDGSREAAVSNTDATVFSVINSREEQKRPVIRSFSIDKTNVSSGDVIKVTADAEDESGIAIIECGITRSEYYWYGYAQYVGLIPDENGIPTGYIHINKGWVNGEYSLKVNGARDILGNYAPDDDDSGFTDYPLPPKKFYVSGCSDTASLSSGIKNASISSKEVYLGDEVTIVIEADELPTSLAGFDFSAINPDGPGGSVDIVRRADGKFEGKFIVDGRYFKEDVEYRGMWIHLPSGREVILGYEDGVEPISFKVLKKKVPESVVLDKKLLVLDKGESGKLTATVTPADAEDKTVTWSSSNTNVATVDNTGNVTAVNHGTAKITAKTSNGKTAACEVRVNFADVASTSQYYYKPVYWAEENKITTGSNGLFAPHSSCTREHAITFLWRMAGSPQPKSMVSKFKDIQNKNSYSYKAIMWGTEKGIITGAGGVFSPNNTCTREQIVTMLWRLAGKPVPKSTNSKFKDVQNKNSYSYNAILWASEKGITTGANGEFKPGKTCTRAEIVTFIYRYKNTVK